MKGSGGLVCCRYDARTLCSLDGTGDDWIMAMTSDDPACQMTEV